MRRLVCIIMVLLFIATVASGIVDWRTGSGEDDTPHPVFAGLFTASMVVHILINRKRVLKRAVYIIYLAGLPLALFSGLAEEHVHPGEASFHLIVSLIFTVLMIAHIKANFKPLARYFGWRRRNKETPGA
jgi:hypothetical protein